ncbi:hypothetical protein HELRODRAFT_170204 [Helobdella robusta]|uniref:Uncharacterized protein n=1 Tax=Helobdella robusta TaxID=6412 RepID=T1F2S4_HELRO|nr:hypothetical protein HELRODRAFT_170204 [Helobdella robusta]ESO07673.1 hypothetical protein HELRODRAFT_170204 [Helobdella robusta]
MTPTLNEKNYRDLASFISQGSSLKLMKMAQEGRKTSVGLGEVITEVQAFLSSSLDHFLKVQTNLFQDPHFFHTYHQPPSHNFNNTANDNNATTNVNQTGTDTNNNRNNISVVENRTDKPEQESNALLHNEYALELSKVDAILNVHNNEVRTKIVQKFNRMHFSLNQQLRSCIEQQMVYLIQKTDELNISQRQTYDSIAQLLTSRINTFDDNNNNNKNNNNNMDVKDSKKNNFKNVNCKCLISRQLFYNLKRRKVEIRVPENMESFAKQVVVILIAFWFTCLSTAPYICGKFYT